MKIIEIHYFLGGGGASRVMCDLSNYCTQDKNNKVITVTTNDASKPGNDYISIRDDLDSRVKYVALDARSGLSLKSVWGVFMLIHREQPDVVHLHASILLYLLPVIFFPNIRYVHTIHTLVTRAFPGGYRKKIADWMYKTKRVQPVTISAECHASYKKCFGRQDDIMIINGRSNLNTTEKLASVKMELKNLGVREDIPTFLHVSRNHPAKNHDRMFSTFERITSEGISYNLIVIGDHYDDYFDRFKGHGQIHLIGPRTNIGDYMSFADFFVLTSDWEGLPLSLLEAMSMGVVPICTPAGGIKDVLRNGENGYLAKDISDDAFYHAVKQALAERGKIPSESIIKEYQENYTFEACAERYMKLYKGYKGICQK